MSQPHTKRLYEFNLISIPRRNAVEEFAAFYTDKIEGIRRAINISTSDHFLASTGCYDTFQSGFRPLHSTETALIKVVNDIRLNTDSGKTSILMLLDLSAAFNTVDHTILLDRLENWAGLSGTVLNWFRSYLQNRNYFVSIGDFVSEIGRAHV